MGPITNLLLGTAGLFGAVLFAIVVRQGSDEFKAWTPCLTNKLLEKAVLWLPERKRERYREEWASHINDVPGEAGKWIEACSCLLSARRIAKMEAPVRVRAKKVRRIRIFISENTKITISENVLGMSAALYAKELLHVAHHGSLQGQPLHTSRLARLRVVYSILRSVAAVFR